MTASGAAPRPAPHGHTRRGALAVQPSPTGRRCRLLPHAIANSRRAGGLKHPAGGTHLAAGKHASPENARAARPRGRAQAPQGARASRAAQAPRNARRAKTAGAAHPSRRGTAVLAAVCMLALAAGFLLQSFLPVPVSVSADERVSSSMVRLSEVMSSNASAVKADNGQYSDWVEIVNTGVSDVSLKGYTLLTPSHRSPSRTSRSPRASTSLFIATAR